MAARRKPGASIPESDRHTVKRQLRLTPAESAALDAAAVALEVNTSRAVGIMAQRYAAAFGKPTWDVLRAEVAAIEARQSKIRQMIDGLPLKAPRKRGAR